MFLDFHSYNFPMSLTHSVDFWYIVNRTNLSQKITNIKAQLNSFGYIKQQVDRISKYFQQLEPNVKKRLYELYRMDFELFDYDGKQFL